MVPNAQPFVPNTASLEGEGVCVGLTPTPKRRDKKSEDKKLTNPWFLVESFCIFAGRRRCYAGAPARISSPFQPFCEPNNSLHDFAILGIHENRDRRGESLKRWETWFLFGPGYCT